MKKWSQISPITRAIIFGIAACAVIPLIGLLPDSTNDARLEPAKGRPARVVESTSARERDTSNDCIRAGEICQLSGRLLDSLEWTPTTATLTAHEELHKAIQANDKDGIGEMLQQGRVLDTKPGEHIRILDVSVWSGWIEGRMTSGKHAGRKVWVARRFVKRVTAGT